MPLTFRGLNTYLKGRFTLSRLVGYVMVAKHTSFNLVSLLYPRKKIVIEDPAVLNKKSAYGDEEDKLNVFLYRWTVKAFLKAVH